MFNLVGYYHGRKISTTATLAIDEENRTILLTPEFRLGLNAETLADLRRLATYKGAFVKETMTLTSRHLEVTIKAV